jgi:cell division protein FtsQ
MIKRIRPNRRRTLNTRPRRGRKTALARVLVALTVLVAGTGAGWYGWLRTGPDLLAWADRFFVIRTVDLSETRRVSRDQVLALLDLQTERGLLRTDPAALQRTLETHPWIRRAAVKRVLPATLAVDIQEREPVAILRTGRGDFLVDYEGVLLMERPPQHDETLPVLKGVDYAEAVLREPWTAERLQTGIALAGLLGQAVGRPPVVDLGTPGDFVAYDAGFRLRFGDGQFWDKVDRYRQVSDRVLDLWGDRERTARARKVEVDLRFRDKVIVRAGR